MELDKKLEKISEEDVALIKEKVKKIPNFPEHGVLFYDLFSILKDPVLHQKTFQIAENLTRNFIVSNDIEINAIVGLESRGFLLGLIIADRLKLPFVPVRKKNKLPGRTYKICYSTEYSQDQFEMQTESLDQNSKVLIVDDLLATGGSMKAAEELVSMTKAETVGYFVLFEIDFLKGKEKLSKPKNLITMITI